MSCSTGLLAVLKGPDSAFGKGTMQAQRAGIHTNTCIRHAHLHRGVSVSKRVPPLHATTAPRFLQLPNIADFSTLGADVDEEPPERFRDVKVLCLPSPMRLAHWISRDNSVLF